MNFDFDFEGYTQNEVITQPTRAVGLQSTAVMASTTVHSSYSYMIVLFIHTIMTIQSKSLCLWCHK